MCRNASTIYWSRAPTMQQWRDCNKEQVCAVSLWLLCRADTYHGYSRGHVHRVNVVAINERVESGERCRCIRLVCRGAPYWRPRWWDPVEILDRLRIDAHGGKCLENKWGWVVYTLRIFILYYTIKTCQVTINSLKMSQCTSGKMKACRIDPLVLWRPAFWSLIHFASYQWFSTCWNFLHLQITAKLTCYTVESRWTIPQGTGDWYDQQEFHLLREMCRGVAIYVMHPFKHC